MKVRPLQFFRYSLSIIFICCLFLGNVRELVDYLNESLELLTRNSNILDNVLETLDIQQHSLGYMYILLAKFADVPAAVQALADTDTVVKLVRNFTNLCNGEQVRSAPNQCKFLFPVCLYMLIKTFFL